LKRTELTALRTLLQTHQLTLTDAQTESLWRYAELLVEWNQKINLISRKDEEAVLSKHVLHSLAIGLFHTFKKGERVLDLGSGGGLPGMPLAIAFPDAYFLLIDSIGKKVAACQDMAVKLGLKNVLAQKSRSEDLKNVEFDVVVSRQVAPMLDLVKWSQNLLTKNGKLICLKGGDLEEEIGAALIYGAEHLTFPENIEEKSIEFLGEKFEDKCVVIAT
jgi:16S rRNA (guanine527-N7)-methyltransferase